MSVTWKYGKKLLLYLFFSFIYNNSEYYTLLWFYGALNKSWKNTHLSHKKKERKEITIYTV